MVPSGKVLAVDTDCGQRCMRRKQTLASAGIDQGGYTQQQEKAVLIINSVNI